MNMDFFKQLSALSTGLDLSIRIKEKNGKLTVSVLPEGGSGDSKIKPLNMTGTPDELDEGFFSRVAPAIEATSGLTDNLEEVKKSATAAKEKSQAKESSKRDPKSRAPKKKAPTKKAAPEKKTVKKEKPAVKEKVVKKTAPAPKLQERSMFDGPGDADEGKTDQQIDEELTKESIADTK